MANQLARHWLLAVAAISCLILVAPRQAVTQSVKPRNALAALQGKHQERYREFAIQLEKLVQFCEEKGLADAADQARSRLVSPESLSNTLPALPREVRDEIPAQVVGDDRYWQTQLRFLEDGYALELFKLSRDAFHSGHPSYAYNLVREAALHNPDHKQARKVLGFVQHGNEWVTPFAASQLKKQYVWHEEFGWLPKAFLERYAKGERNFEGRWVSAEKERVLRQDFIHAWTVRTDHFLIKTNVSLEHGVRLGRALEDFHEFFHETFAGFFNTPEQVQKLLEGTARSTQPDGKPYVVHVYRTREEYIDHLRREFPDIAKTNGIYLSDQRIAHFYYDPNNNDQATLFHEATHQLFYESHQAKRPIGERAHFWIIEGIACYMESFQHENGTISLGDPGYIRFAGARTNLLAEKSYYVPLREFSGLGKRDFQYSQELAKNYTQASGLARFFMDYDNGRYREALVTHLAQLYSGDNRTRDRAQALDVLTGIDFDELDRQYAADARQTEQAAAQP